MHKSFLFSFFLTHIMFSLEIQNIDHDWRGETIKEELTPFKNIKLTTQQIKNYEMVPEDHLYIIRKNKLKVLSHPDYPHNIDPRSRDFQQALNLILKNKKLPNMTFILHTGDFYSYSKYKKTPNEKTPILVW